MCDHGKSMEPEGEHSGNSPAGGRWRRRDLLRASAVGGGALLGGGALIGGGVLLGAAQSAPAAHSATVPSAKHAQRQRGLELVLLGTAAGPVPDPKRAGISSALIVDGAVYLVDAGLGAPRQFAAAGLDRSALRNMFITHLHADHLMSYYDFFLTAPGRPAPVTAHGPGPAGALPPKEQGSTPGTVDPRDPTPGLKDHTEDCHAAFAYSSNILMRSVGSADPRDLVDVHDIALPAVGASALGDTAPRMRPFPVMEDKRVKVTATLVPHGPVFPSFAFRFDTDHGSVTFSGDTRPTPNLVQLAHDTDLLVHEAVPDAAMQAPGLTGSHSRASHTALSQVGGIAQRCGARRLVLSHIGSGTSQPIDSPQWTRTVKQTYDGPVTVGADLMRFTVTARS
ncbi:MBL fold metallo-hydrolase [Streptomyces platensis]|uniref:MBL fold metallo-hydrolase n=1 Tax=Streptomyces platensis TaxID=58346 RepID=A0AAE6TLK5_STRPT|nr:MBL fold metallo-hydrolase [Streptomyces platensis]OSY46170.1 ribonuclease Z [Streptomyces platensis]QEV51692.1 MBL fold metallo-hydrolase [Streptomyces platensis]